MKRGLKAEGQALLLAVLATVAVVVAAVHWPVLHAQARAQDDDLFVSDNVLVRQPSWESTTRFFTEVLSPSTVGGYYLPLTMTSLMADVALGGGSQDLAQFHRTNLLLHLASVILLGLFVYSLFGRAVPAGIAALLFGIHPLTVEPVAWISERKTLLASCFAFASLLFYVRHCRSGGRGWMLLSLLCFALGLLAKPSILGLPLVLLTLDFWPLGRLGGRAIVEKWPHFLVSAGSFAVSTISQMRTLHPVFISNAGWAQPALQVCYLLAFYLGKILWPLKLAPMYDPPVSFTLSQPEVLISLVTVLAVLGAVLLAGRRSRAVPAAALVFLLALSPTFLILKWSHLIAYDRYLYFPAVGIVLLVGYALTLVWDVAARSSPARRVALMAAGIAVAALEGWSARATLHHWRNSLTLWQQAVSVSPRVPDAHNELALALEGAGRFDEAAAEYRRALAINPNYALAVTNLGRLETQQGHFEEAIQFLQDALQRAPGDEGVVFALGRAEAAAGRLREGEAHLRRANELAPDNIETLEQLAILLSRQGQLDEALAFDRKALELSPTDAHPHFIRALLLQQSQGADSEVVGQLDEAVRLAPNWDRPKTALAWILATSPSGSIRDASRARSLAAQAVDLTHGQDANALDALAAAQAGAAQFEDAVRTARAAQSVATAHRDTLLAAGIQKRLDLYGHGKTFVQATATPPKGRN